MGSDIGLNVLEFLYKTLQIDEKWSIRVPRGFIWWGHRLAQRVFVEPVRHSRGFVVARLSAETSLLRGVPVTRQTAERLGALNQVASLSALVWDPQHCTVRLRCSAGVHAETEGTVGHLLAAAVALQAADAHIKVDNLAKLLGGEPDASDHPASGPRETMDDMLNVIRDFYAPRGLQEAPFSANDFAAATRMAPSPWLEVKTDGPSLRALLRGPGYESGTGVLTVTARERHPQLGSGLLILLQIPTGFDTDLTLALAHELNLAEAHAWEIPYFVGAWCPPRDAKDGVTFTAFLPTGACKAGMIEAMSLQLGARAIWARRQLDEGLADHRAYVRALETDTEHTAPPAIIRRAYGQSLEWRADDIRQGRSEVGAAPASRSASGARSFNARLAVTIALLAALAFTSNLAHQPDLPHALRNASFIGLLAILSYIDVCSGLIPDRITLPAIVLGLLASGFIQPPSFGNALFAGILAGAVVFLIAFFSKGQVGGGLIKMTAMVGAWMGWPNVIVALGVAAVLVACGWVIRRLLSPSKTFAPLECAPYLAASAVLLLIAGY